MSQQNNNPNNQNNPNMQNIFDTLTEQTKKLVFWGQVIGSLVGAVIILYSFWLGIQELKLVTKDLKQITQEQQKQLQFNTDFTLITFRQDIKKQFEKLKRDRNDIKASDLDKFIQQCSLVEQAGYMTSEYETYCNVIRSADLTQERISE